MARASRSLALVLLVAPAFSRAGQIDPQTERAQKLLQASMRRSFSRNIVAIVVQRDPNSVGPLQTVKIERSKAGKVRQTVLHPLRMQGIESIDDGTRTLMYLPDQKMLIEQNSPQMEPGDATSRAELAARNYRLRVEEGGTTAGQKTVCVVAVPKHQGKETRRYYLDEKTGYPLKMVTTLGKEPVVRFETREIQYPAALDERLFEMRTIGGLTHVRYRKPETFANPTEAENAMGFRPAMPQRLPLGFRVTEMQTNDSPQWRSLVVRMTDGLVKATLYQWKTTAHIEQVTSVENRTSAEANGVSMLLVSELTSEQREQMMASFASAEWPDFDTIATYNDPPPGQKEPKKTFPTFSPNIGLVALALLRTNFSTRKPTSTNKTK
ncbi:MAG: sigma-E factor regulatory protein RseB domain-containing protein [Fimbriimonas sp.]